MNKTASVWVDGLTQEEYDKLEFGLVRYVTKYVQNLSETSTQLREYTIRAYNVCPVKVTPDGIIPLDEEPRREVDVWQIKNYCDLLHISVNHDEMTEAEILAMPEEQYKVLLERSEEYLKGYNLKQ